jgi:hypothetical protein
MRNKFVSLVIIFSILLSIISMNIASVKGTISTPYVEVTPNVVNQNADYKIVFTINQSLPYLGKITVIFPMGTGIPCSSCNPYIPASSLSVNGVGCTQNGNGNTTSRTVDIYTPISLATGSQVTVFISRTARITTPPAEGTYTLQVYTSSETGLVTSQPFKIGKSQLSSPKVTLSNNITSRNSVYSLTFNAGSVYDLYEGVDSITVTFPKGTYVPPLIKGTSIIVNNVQVIKDSIISEENSITVSLPLNVPAGASITLQFTLDAGIKNPSEAGLRTLFVSSSKDPTKVESAPYEILDISSSATQIIINPSSPEGNNGWYATLPIVAFIPRLPSDNGAIVYYKIDQGDFLVFSIPFTIPEGIHTISYYTVNTNNEIEPVQGKEIKVDATAPALEITEPQENTRIASKNCTIKGTISDISKTKLLVNGEEVNVSNPSFEITENLKEGLNTFSFICIDEAGNQTSRNLNITVSTEIPKIFISSPKDLSEIRENYVNISGTVDIPSTLTVNGDSVPVNDDGSFVYTLLLDNVEKGFFLIKIVATSPESGLSATRTVTVVYNPKPKEILVKLTIGSISALINENFTTLDSPPYIDPKTSRTLVPLRFIAEAFGAEVRWEAEFKTVTITLNNREIKLQIGNNTAYVDNEQKTLEQPPVIQNGRTMVPIRFIAEAFGATVNWDDTTKTIEITYPLP